MKKAYLFAIALSLATGGAMANEHTLVFDGDNDMYGLTRQTTIDPNVVEFVSSFSFSEGGIDFSLTNTAETGKGFALVNAGGTNAGIFIYSGMASATYISPKISLTVPNGKISGVKFYMSGSQNNAALISLDVFFNEAEVSSEREGNLFCWNWNAASDGPETVTIEFENKFYIRYIHSIQLTYSEDLGGKQECGLAFSEPTALAVAGESFTGPTLDNPNGLSISWSSTEEAVATVDSEGNVTPLAAGKSKIVASTEGNDEYAAGNASYELTVIPTAGNLLELAQVAPEVYDQAKVCFPLTVTFASKSFAFVLDEEGNAGYIYDIRYADSTSPNVQTIYQVGNVIPAGWIATNGTIYESVIWEGIPGDVEENVEVTYPEVESVTPADVDRVVILKNVTFTTETASGMTKAYGTTPDGTTYEFQDTFNAGSKPAGTYDVTCIVRYSKRGTTEYFYLSPIGYTDSEPSSVEGISIEKDSARYYDLQGNEIANPAGNVYIKVLDGKSTKVIVK